MTNLTYLHSLQTLHLPKTELTPEQQTQLEEAFPGVQILPTVELLGQEYDTATTVLDLSAMTSDQVAQAAEKLYIHKNTLLYRVHKLLDVLDLADAGAFRQEYTVRLLLEHYKRKHGLRAL